MIKFTDHAAEVLETFLAGDPNPSQALRIAVTGPTTAPHFDLTLIEISESTEDERSFHVNDIQVLIREKDLGLLEGATVDYVERANESGFEIRPDEERIPKSTLKRTDSGEPTGEIADAVRMVLDNQVNPAISAHGGMISLVDVEDTDIYVEMSGGCQGCALSRMTLRQGVERMLRDAVPELTAVHDVTDHSSGENPYL
ncbi:MAG: NifU family protein [Gemmatimonadota bacterium]|nr:NifU family protein [Gemmatimonadota bacterium]|tara:strand:- start:13646 stop:14242 length:597 start_codon:yes stop_codon:yes gene_type:complete